MHPRILLPVVAAGAVALATANAEVTYDSAFRSVTVWAGSPAEPDVMDTISSAALGLFDESLSASTSEGVTGTAAQTSYILPRSFSGSGHATGETGAPVGSGYGDGESYFEVSFTIDIQTPFMLTGDIDGFGVYSFTGPSINIEDMSFGPKSATFGEIGTLDAGAYTFIISAAAESVDDISGSFSLEVVLGGSCPADITGPLGPGNPDGFVDALDLLLVLAQWSTPCVGSCEGDITGPGCLPDGNVDAMDLMLLLGQWGS